MSASVRWKNHAVGIVRGSIGGKWFGQLRRVNNHCHVTIRKTETGELVRFAGIWGKVDDAKQEVADILNSVEARS